MHCVCAASFLPWSPMGECYAGSPSDNPLPTHFVGKPLWYSGFGRIPPNRNDVRYTPSLLGEHRAGLNRGKIVHATTEVWDDTFSSEMHKAFSFLVDIGQQTWEAGDGSTRGIVNPIARPRLQFQRVTLDPPMPRSCEPRKPAPDLFPLPPSRVTLRFRARNSAGFPVGSRSFRLACTIYTRKCTYTKGRNHGTGPDLS